MKVLKVISHDGLKVLTLRSEVIRYLFLAERYEDYRTNCVPDAIFPKVLIFSVLPREI